MASKKEDMVPKKAIASMKKTASVKRMAAYMKHVALIGALMAALSPAVSPVSAQVRVLNGQQPVAVPRGLQQPGSQGGPPSPSQAPTTGTFCIQEMTATFCNVPVGPNTNGYGSGSGTASTGGSASSGGSAASAGARVNASSLPPCMREPAANELCY